MLLHEAKNRWNRVQKTKSSRVKIPPSKTLDISKVFDKVRICCSPLHKLNLFGVSGPIFEIIKSFSDGRRLKVVLVTSLLKYIMLMLAS